MKSRMHQRFFLTVHVLAAALLLALPAHAAGGGLVLIPEVPMLVTLIVAFVVLIFPLNALIFRPLLHVLDERNDRIAGARERAEKHGEDAAQILDQYQRAVRGVREESEQHRRSELDSARAEQMRVTGGARDEANGEIERARAELANALGDARASLRGNTQELARDIAAQVLGRSLS